jgi:antitoxin VapB
LILSRLSTNYDLDIRISNMPLYIKDETTAQLVAELARRRGLTKQDAVRLAVTAELGRGDESLTVREKLERFWRATPMPPKTGLPADKAFFDDLSGESE